MLKVVVDAQDYKQGTTKVKLAENKIVIEGKIDIQEGSSVSTQTFLRRFPLPESADLDKIAASLSKDGILKVIAPKKVDLFSF